MSDAFHHVVGIVGHPRAPDVAWSDQQLLALKEIGINTLQLSIAWAWRPAGEVLNLEDLDRPEKWAEFHRRVAQAHRFDLAALGHFGLPVGPQADATTCILDSAVRENYASRLRAFFRDFDADDVLIYTYDQHAWLCSEFGDCPRCRGIPLHERLTPFLEEMGAAVQDGRHGARLWWEPWELSEGQLLAVVERIRPQHFGLIMHNTIAEVQFVNETDLAFRNVARLAGSRGIPVIGEAFLGSSGEDIEPLLHMACPRLVYQQLEALRRATGVVGIKEYYGLVPAHFSVNVALLAAYLRSPGTAFEALVDPIAAAYGPQVHRVMLEAWDATAQAMEFFPWNASWHLRRIFGAAADKEWQEVPGGIWQTPAWQASRRGFYLVIDHPSQHPWLREDVGLRARAAARRFARAGELLASAEAKAANHQDDIRRQRLDVERAALVAGQLGEGLLAHRASLSQHFV